MLIFVDRLHNEIMSQKVTIVTSDVVKIRPFVDKERIKEIAEKCFGLQIDESSEISEAISYDDRNFIFKGIYMLPCKDS